MDQVLTKTEYDEISNQTIPYFIFNGHGFTITNNFEQFKANNGICEDRFVNQVVPITDISHGLCKTFIGGNNGFSNTGDKRLG